MDWPFEHNVPKYPWNPRRLFMDGSVGFWLDFTDPTSWAQNSDGTVAATSLGDPVGFVRDKSGQGYNPTMTVASSRPTHGRMPKGGVRNRLLATDSLSTQSRTVTAVQLTLSFTGTGTVSLSGVSTAGPLIGTGVNDRVSLTFTPTAGALTLTVSGSVTFAQLESGSVVTPYQKVVQAHDVTEAGVPSIPCLWFDGTDDWLDMTSSGAGLLRNCSRFTVVAGAEFTSAITASRALFLASIASDNGSARLTLQGQATGNLAVRGRRLDANSIATANTSQNVFEAGVFSTVVSYETAVAQLRRNSSQVAINNAFQTAGNTSDSNSAGVHIGRLSTAYFGGFMSSVIAVRNTSLSEAQLTNAERFLMNQMGVAV